MTHNEIQRLEDLYRLSWPRAIVGERTFAVWHEQGMSRFKYDEIRDAITSLARQKPHPPGLSEILTEARSHRPPPPIPLEPRSAPSPQAARWEAVNRKIKTLPGDHPARVLNRRLFNAGKPLCDPMSYLTQLEAALDDDDLPEDDL